jgi:hypothetical protein
MRLAYGMFCVAIAGCGGDGSAEGGSTSDDSGGSTTAMSGTSPTTTQSSTTTSTSATAETSSGDSTTVVETGDASTSGSTSGDESSSSTAVDGTSSGSESSGSDSGSESGVVMHQACTDGCAIEFMCGDEWASAEECTEWCEANLVEAAMFSPFCADAWENLSACFATLDCDQFAEYQAPMMFPYPCSDAADALAFECEGQ